MKRDELLKLEGRRQAFDCFPAVRSNTSSAEPKNDKFCERKHLRGGMGWGVVVLVGLALAFAWVLSLTVASRFVVMRQRYFKDACEAVRNNDLVRARLGEVQKIVPLPNPNELFGMTRNLKLNVSGAVAEGIVRVKMESPSLAGEWRVTKVSID